MKNNLARAITFTVALCLACQHAKAETATFILPFEVHWGSVVLEPGPHRMFVQTTQSERYLVAFSEKHDSGLMLALTGESHDEGAESYLKIVNVDGKQFVREYYSGVTGKKLTFLVPAQSPVGKKVPAIRRVAVNS